MADTVLTTIGVTMPATLRMWNARTPNISISVTANIFFVSEPKAYTQPVIIGKPAT